MTNKEIIELMRKQLDQQQIQLQLQREQLEQQNNAILQALQMITRQKRPAETTNQQVAEVQQNSYSVPKFSEFDPSNELWSDYNQRFQTFVKAHSVPKNKIAKIFLTNQSLTTNKLLQNLSSQQQPPVDINEAEMDLSWLSNLTRNYL